jgi:hypothetical protein
MQPCQSYCGAAHARAVCDLNVRPSTTSEQCMSSRHLGCQVDLDDADAVTFGEQVDVFTIPTDLATGCGLLLVAARCSLGSGILAPRAVAPSAIVPSAWTFGASDDGRAGGRRDAVLAARQPSWRRMYLDCEPHRTENLLWPPAWRGGTIITNASASQRLSAWRALTRMGARISGASQIIQVDGSTSYGVHHRVVS